MRKYDIDTERYSKFVNLISATETVTLPLYETFHWTFCFIVRKTQPATVVNLGTTERSHRLIAY